MYSPSQAIADKEATKVATNLRARLEPIENTFRSISSWLSDQLLECNHQIPALKLRTCFESLPDEILAHVLEFVVVRHCEDTRRNDKLKTIAESAITAVKLSHVCARFRRLVTSSSTF